MKKLVFCIPFLYNSGGMERVLTEKVNYLASKEKYDITIITTDQGDRPVYFTLDSRIKLLDLKLDFDKHYEYSLLRKYYVHNRKLKLYKKKLESYLQKNNIDICISLCGKEIDFFTSLKDGSCKIAELHFSKNHRTQFLQAHKLGLFWKWIGEFRTWQLERATQKLNRLVVLTQQDLNDWRKSNTNVISIPNPSPLKPKRIAALDNKLVIAVGRLDAQKGYDYLISAWEIVAKKNPDWVLNIYGDGNLRDDLQEQIRTTGLEGKVCLKGTTKNIEDEYLSGAIYVMCSRYEGLPMVLIEAMTCGLPLVSFDCECGPREVIQDGKNGFLVPTFDIELLSERLMELMKDINLRKKMGVQSKEMSKAYEIDEIMKQWINLFELK